MPSATGGPDSSCDSLMTSWGKLRRHACVHPPLSQGHRFFCRARHLPSSSEINATAYVCSVWPKGSPVKTSQRRCLPQSLATSTQILEAPKVKDRCCGNSRPQAATAGFWDPNTHNNNRSLTPIETTHYASHVPRCQPRARPTGRSFRTWSPQTCYLHAFPTPSALAPSYI